MLGLFHYLIESWATEAHGEEIWRLIKAQAGIINESWVTSCPYADTQTFKLLQAAATITNTPVEAVQQSIGQHQILFLSSIGHEQLLRNMASTLADFIYLLNDLHHSLKITYPSLAEPSFRVDKVLPVSQLVISRLHVTLSDSL